MDQFNNKSAPEVSKAPDKCCPALKVLPCLSRDAVKSAMQHLAAGRRNLLVQDYQAAEASLSQACEMFAKQYGETAIECAEPCFYYGKALLELARLEAGVINNGLEGGKDEVGSL